MKIEKHIHVEARKGRFRKSAKFWLEPDVELVDSGDFTIRELKIIIKIINENKLTIILQIEKFLSGRRVKLISL